MKRNARRKIAVWLALPVLAALILAGRQIYMTGPGYGIPLRPQFRPEAPDRWTALGGTWEVVDGSMRNDSNDRGAKLITGSSHWKNYSVVADLQLLGNGSVGLLARVSEAEVGENSFKGYFAAIRSVDNSLVLGSFDFAYHEAAKVRVPVQRFHWYRVRLDVDGCRITASASSSGMREIRTEPLTDADCFRSGMIGLRSNGTGGVWRNVAVLPAGAPAPAPEFLPEPVPPAGATALAAAKPAREANPPVQPIVGLQYLSPIGRPLASIRGSVVSTRPAIYIEDSTGGVAIEPQAAVLLKVGDEVEVKGEVCLDNFSPVVQKAQVRIVREDVPASPMALTANQIAAGAYDGRFVQVDARLLRTEVFSDGSAAMELDAGSQSFHAILPRGRTRSHLGQFTPESRIRLRGVSVADRRFNRMADPFVLLVRSAEDIDLVTGPPWWRPSTLIFTSLVTLALAFAINHAYLRVKHWRLRAVAQERERLAHEIHDTLAQSFAGIGFQLQAIRNSMPPGAAALQRQLELAMLMTRTSHEEARRSIASLRPRSLGATPLLPALRACAENMVQNGSVTVETYGEGSGRGIPSRIKDTLYRIGQEAIANSIRHAGPKKIRIGLERAGAAIRLSVEDDGSGFMADPECAGFGLPGMRKKAESIAATLHIQSSPGAGTRVEVKAPVGSRLRSLFRSRGPLFS